MSPLMHGLESEMTEACEQVENLLKVMKTVDDFKDIEYRKNFENYTFNFKGLHYKIKVQLLSDKSGNIVNSYMIEISLPAGGKIFKKPVEGETLDLLEALNGFFLTA